MRDSYFDVIAEFTPQSFHTRVHARAGKILECKLLSRSADRMNYEISSYFYTLFIGLSALLLQVA